MALPSSIFISIALGILSFLSAAYIWSVAFYFSVFALTVLYVYRVKLRAFPPPSKSIRCDQPPSATSAAKLNNDSQHSAPLSPIGQAAMEGDVATIKHQLAAGVSVEGPPSDWMTPLMWASAKGQEPAARVLLDSGANANARNEVGITALWEAARTGRLAIVKELVARHADVNARVIPRVGGDTPLMCAADFGHADVAKFLVQHGADPRAKNAKGQTAAQLAASSGFSELANWLREPGYSSTTENQ